MAQYGGQDWKDKEKESLHDTVFGPVLGLPRLSWKSGNGGVRMAWVKSSAPDHLEAAWANRPLCSGHILMLEPHIPVRQMEQNCPGKFLANISNMT
jgi:hypothetical protein